MSPLARRSALVLGLLFGLVFAVGTGLMWYLNQPVSHAIIFALVVTLLQYLFAPLLIDLIFTIRWADPQEISQEFSDWYFETSNRLGIALPRFGIISDGNPNAFTYGRTRGDARLVLTSGLVDILTPEELKAVVAHEMGHIHNRDFIVMTVAQAIPLVLYVLYAWTRDRSKGSYAIAVSIGAYLVYIFSLYVVLALSRLREFFADESSARITTDPNSLSSALVKISYGLSRQQEKLARKQLAEQEKENKTGKVTVFGVSAGAAALGIANVKAAGSFALIASDAAGAFSETAMANALRWDIKNPWAKWFQLGSTHPLTARRVIEMNKAASRLGHEPVYKIDTRLSSLDQYLGSFAREFLIYALPILGGAASLAVSAAHLGAIVWGEFLTYGCIGYGVGSFIKTLLIYPRLNGPLRTVEDLVGREINASPVNAVPCVVEGEIIGRGVPGLFWSDDLVLRDETGFILLQYRQPLDIFEFLFGWLKAGHFIKRQARVTGWYRRAPNPYIEISRVEIIDGMRGNVRCYYRAGALVFSVILVLAGLFLTGLI